MNPPFQLRAHHANDDPLLRDGRAARALMVLVDASVWVRVQESDDLPDILLRTAILSERITMTLYGDDDPQHRIRRDPGKRKALLEVQTR